MSELTVAGLQKLVDGYVTERDWKRYHRPKDIAISISIESSELLELFQWRQDPPGAEEMSSDARVRLGEELADVVIYCICMANAVGLDLGEVILDKIEKNREKYPVGKVADAKDWDEVVSRRERQPDAEGDG